MVNGKAYSSSAAEAVFMKPGEDFAWIVFVHLP